MAFIKRRITKAGTTSTALVESYRGEGGPRQRVIANMHGMESLAVALGRLAALRHRLRVERAELERDLAPAEEFYRVMTSNTLGGRVWTAEERKEIDRLMRDRKRLLKRVAEIDKQLAQIQKEGAAIKKYCAATNEEIRAEADSYAKRLDEDKAFELGLKEMAKMRRRI
ncbi:MAG TPA: hypothetical protein DDW48_02795 [Methyloceanibacter sp.]|nr:hypothetical protein [Methyloceanibacter sp.]